MIKITYYLDVISSWCHYVEPVLQSLKNTFEEEIEIRWEIALIPEDGLPGSAAEEEWYYRRSGMMTKQSVMLNSDWIDLSLKEYLAANAVPVACRELGFAGDNVRLAITQAGIVEGKRVGEYDVCAAIAAEVSGLDRNLILRTAKSDQIEKLVRRSSEKFDALGVNQRPTFVLKSEIDDQAVFSGLVQAEPLVTTIQAMIEDVKSYRSWAAHFGDSYQA